MGQDYYIFYNSLVSFFFSVGLIKSQETHNGIQNKSDVVAQAKPKSMTSYYQKT